MLSGSVLAHDDSPVTLVDFDSEKYQTIFKHIIIATQEDSKLRACKSQTFDSDMQHVSPKAPLAVLVLIFGDIITSAQDEVVIQDIDNSNNSVALTLFVMYVFELYSNYLAAQPMLPCDWFAKFVSDESDTAERLWTSMIYTANHLAIDGLNLNNMNEAAKWFSRFYNEIVGRYNVQDTPQRKRASKNKKAAAKLKEIVDILQKRVSLACLPAKKNQREEHEACLIIRAHRERVSSITADARVQVISDLPLAEIIAVIKSLLLTLCQKDNANMIPLLLQIFSVNHDAVEDKVIAKQIFSNLSKSTEELRPLTRESRKRMQANHAYWHELQLWLMGAAERIKLINHEIKYDLTQVFISLHAAVNYIDNTLSAFYREKWLPENYILVGNRNAVFSEINGLLKLYTHCQMQMPREVGNDNNVHAQGSKIENTSHVLMLWRRLTGEFYETVEDEAACRNVVQITNPATMAAARALGLPDHYENFMAAQHIILNQLQHVQLTDETLVHWAALAARFKVLTFAAAAKDEIRSELSSLYKVIAIALQMKVAQYQACQQQRHSPLLSHHMHAAHDTGHDLPEYAECSIDLNFLDDPIICVLDGRSYSPAIVTWLNTKKTAPMNNAELGNKCPTQVLFPNSTLKKLLERYKALDAEGMKAAVECPLSRTPMLDAVFCRLDNRTYSRKSIAAYLEINRQTPGDSPVRLDEDQLVSAVMCEDYNMQEAVRNLYPELEPEESEESQASRISDSGGCCRIL